MKVSIQQQSVLYGNDIKAIERSLESIARAAELGAQCGVSQYTVSYGDSSPAPCLSEQQLSRLGLQFPNITIKYDFFEENLGSARGHNRLAASAASDFLLIQNPDVIPSPRLLQHLLLPFSDKSVGMVEAKQVPIEHPKEYDRRNGDTSWASTASALVRKETFDLLEGFDADTFFLYCDDVDFSWRVRELGLRVIFQPAAVAFHDKRLSKEGTWHPTASERYYSAEAALLLSYKWSRHDLTKQILASFQQSGDEAHKKAVDEFERRRLNNLLPVPRDLKHKIAQFIDGNYAQHRYAL